ncbi:Tetraspanin family [Nesidiocoris tenuis]|uniref:Tetraspanin n=1 Tax=Nesidiocoris tenuis TaxID=355587 RepID=A0ABN7AGA1_9HEMI|nr:Tetraspanin family [Nesidiocoris tenuis]
MVQEDNTGKLAAKVDNRIRIIRGILLCMNAITWFVAIAVIVICFWLRFDYSVKEWISRLEIESFYIGLYIIIVSSVIIFITGFISCFATISENIILLLANIVVQVLLFIIGMAGACVLMQNSAYKSSIHPVISSVMLKLIELAPNYDAAAYSLSLLQEDIGCCGANGVDDYFNMKRAVPNQCRDSVTGNVYFYGCADELTWFLEQRSSWLIGLVIALCCKKMLNAVLTAILIQLVQKYNKYSV